MGRRAATLFLLLFLLLALAAVVWQRGALGPGRRPAPVASHPAPASGPTAAAGFRATEVRHGLEALGRLPPDARLAAALAEVRRLTAGTDGDVEARWKGSAWELADDRGRVLARLPALASFDAATAALAAAADPAWVAEVRRRASGARPAWLQGLEAEEIVGGLLEIDARWRVGDREAGDLRAAAEGLARLLYAVPQRVPVETDALAGRAWAVLALAERVWEDKLWEARAWLAWRLGYTAAADEAAGHLDAGDPFRWYVRREDARLEKAARSFLAGRGGSGLAADLWLLRLAEMRETRRWARFAAARLRDRPVGLYHLAAARRLGGFGPHEKALALAVAQLYARATGRAAPWGAGVPVDLDGAVSAFEAGLARMADEAAGPLLDGVSLRLLHRAHFYGALFGLGEIEIALRNVPERSRALLDRLRAVPAPPPALAAVAGTLAFLHEAEFGEPLRSQGTPAVARRLRELSERLGPEAARRALGRLLRHVGVRQPARLVLAQAAMAGCEARPDHLAACARLAAGDLLLLPVAEGLYAALRRLAPWGHEVSAAWAMALAGDHAALRAWSREPRVPTLARIYALELLPQAQVRAADFEDVLRTAPESWHAWRRYARWLEGRGRLDDAERVVRRWLARTRARVRDTRRGDAIAMQARLLRRQGRTEAAWRVIRRHVAGQQGVVLAEAVRVALARADVDGARRIAQLYRRRYPGSARAHVALARVRWHEGRHRDAAADLVRNLGGWSHRIWGEVVGAAMAEAFGDDAPRALAAWEALRAAGLDGHRLYAVAGAFGRAGRHRTAFELLRRTPLRGILRAQALLEAAAHLEEAEGAESAARWIGQQGLGRLGDGAVAILHGEGWHELAWRIPRDLGRAAHPDAAWYMRAASGRLGRTLTAERRRAALRALAGLAPSRYTLLARFLLDEAREAEVARLVVPRRKLGEVGYALGVRAIAEGRIEDAAWWLRVAVEARHTGEAEYHWAWMQLALWAQQAPGLGAGKACLPRFLYSRPRPWPAGWPQARPGCRDG